MNNHMTDEALERLLTDYGQLPPPTAFAYRPKPLFSMKRLAALSVAALLSLLILGLSAGIAAHFAGGIPSYTYSPSSNGPPVVHNPSTTPSDSEPVNPDGTTTAQKPPATTPDVTEPPVDPPIDPPPVTEPALPSLLPAWYSGTEIRLVNFILSSSTPTFTPAELKEIYNDYASFDLDMGDFDYNFVSADLILLEDKPADHQEDFCQVVYLRPSDGEMICLGHELQNLWASVDVDFNAITGLGYLHASHAGNRYVVEPSGQSGEIGTFVYDRTAGTLQKIPFDCANSDFISYSPELSYMVVATMRADADLLDDLWLIDLTTMEVEQICAGYDTFGMSTFSSDQRYVYTHLRIGDSVDSDEHGQWVIYDIETGFSFQGDGQVLYLQDNILISRTYGGGFAAYDCTTGEAPEDLSALPLVIDADFKNYRYTVTVYNPATGEVEATISDVGAYVLRDGYLYYYVHKADGVVIADLESGDSVTLPVSAALLTGASPAEGYTLYSLAVSGDGSAVSLGYTISLNDYYKQKQKDIDALLALIQESALKTNNLPDFWDYFSQRRAPYQYLIEYTDYDIHDGYVILQISFIFNTRNSNETWEFHLVEDHRNGTVTLYNASDNPYYVGSIHARSAYETKMQTFRRPLKKGDYEASCALLPTVGEHRPYYIDYAVCYDQNGKWSDSLAYQARWTYEYLQNEAVYSETSMSKETRERILRIISKYPPIEGISIENHVYRRIMTIRLLNQHLGTIYHAEVVVADNGCYYLRNVSNSRHSRQITYEDYLALMETQNRKIVSSGLYKDPRIAFVPLPLSTASADFLIACTIPSDYLRAEDVNKALAMVREGGHSTDEILTILFPDELWIYIDLLTEYTPNSSYSFCAEGSPYIEMHINNGNILFSDPNPELPLPTDTQ